MLNKKQSKTRNSWKYAVIAPALIAFMLIFQLEVKAQRVGTDTESETSQEEISSYESFSISLEVTKDSKDDELEKEKEFFKKEFDTELQFEDVTRNDNQEITGIKVQVKNKEQLNTYQVSGKKPIKPFSIQIEKNGKGIIKEMKIGAVNTNDELINRITQLSGDNQFSDAPKAVYKSSSSVPFVTTTTIEKLAAAEAEWSVENLKINGDDLLIVINGKQQDKKGNSIKLPSNQEIDEINFLDKKDGRKKYGRKGKKGVVEITTKRYLSANYNIYSSPGSRALRLGNNNSLIRFFSDSDTGELNEALAVTALEVQKLSTLKNILKNADKEYKTFFFDSSDVTPEEYEIIELNETDLAVLKEKLQKAKKQLSSGHKEIDKAMKEAEEAMKKAAEGKEVIIKKYIEIEERENSKQE